MTKQLGDIDAFGLDEFGQPAGLNPVWGVVVGGGVGTLGAIATRQFTKYGQKSEMIGFAAGALASGAMIFFPGTRAAGWAGLASAFLNNGLRQMETMFFKPTAAEGQAPVNGVVIDPTQALQGGPLGIVDIEATQALAEGDMPQLVGANLAAASEHVQLVGGPSLAQHSGHWGSTVIPS